MPDLFHSLQGRDLGYLRIVAGLWGIELNAPDVHVALPGLVNTLLDQKLLAEVIEALPSEAQSAFSELLESEGRLPWSLFTRKFGSVREMGPGRRDRERPYLSPVSIAEMLWYRGLIARAFLKTPGEPIEFAYIPDEFQAWIRPTTVKTSNPPGRPATPAEFNCTRPANDAILDHTCALLASLRMGREAPIPGSEGWGIPMDVVKSLLFSAGLIDNDDNPLPEPTRSFLEAPRGEALALLVRYWLITNSFNELWNIPGLVCEGKWFNDAIQARQAVLDLLSEIPLQAWWNITAFVAGIRERHPDFMRPAGDYDFWFIRAEVTGESLQGFEHWNEVDGAFIRFLICGPLHWLGVLDLASPRQEGEPIAFRFSTWAEALLQQDTPPPILQEEKETVQVLGDGRLRLKPLTPRAARYQVARFCDWETGAPPEFYYRLTPSSLEKAAKQGLHLAQLLGLLRRYTASPISPTLVQALERWDANGTQARMEDISVLRVSSPEILNALRRSPAARFLGDPLGTVAIVVQPGAAEKIRAALIELGYLADHTGL